ncbi:MAG: hypothetical protein FH762_04970 [Firmicutes bacterium]|nr:hypothetical protein [Bacillota bacterium]
MDEASTGLYERLKKTAAISRLGQGMDLGELNDYTHQIALYLLLKVFYREINNNLQRTKNDLKEMTARIVEEMKLTASTEQLERLVDGVLYSGDPRQQAPFSVMLFDENLREHREFKYRYLVPDREASRWDEGGSTVYMLTETSQEIIFLTREVLQEFGFDLEQFYTLQLIKNGNFTEAKSSVSNLIARVRTLIKNEKNWREDIMRNPGLIFSARQERKKRTEGEVRKQFEDEKKVFNDMFRWRDRLGRFSGEQKKEGELLFEELERARALHDRLAELTISNLSLELEIRRENPDIFWKTAQTSFKKDFWQDTIISSGLSDMDLLTELIASLFSPEQGFIFPLDWAWSEQQLYTYLQEEDYEDEEEWEEEPVLKELDWGLLVELWEGVFEELLRSGQYPLNKLTLLAADEQRRWLSQEKNLELFMMFIITEIRLREINEEFAGLDERLVLFNKLLEKNQQFKRLIGKKMTASLETGAEKVKLGEEFEISPYVLYVVD